MNLRKVYDDEWESTHRQSNEEYANEGTSGPDPHMEALRAVYNAGLDRAAEIADQYAAEAREYRDNQTDYPESWVGMQQHGMYHGAQDVVIRIRRAAAIEAEKGQGS